MSTAKPWFLYIIRCASGTLYTGITTDVVKRFLDHQADKGARYLKGKGPLQLVYCQTAGNRSEASRLEIRIKKLSRQQKEQLLNGERYITA